MGRRKRLHRKAVADGTESPFRPGTKDEENFVLVIRKHASTVTLILANLLTIVFAVVQKWNIGDVLWIYWAQSLIIGCFHFLRILDQKQFSTEGWGLPLTSTRKTQWGVACFFLFHYGIFIIAFFVFLRYMWIVLPSMSALALALCIIAFLGTHGFSYWESRQEVVAIKPNIWSLMFHPYARVVPMWLTLTIGIQYAKDYSMTLILFLGLKTVADVFMQVLETEDIMVYDKKNETPTSCSEEAEGDKSLETSKIDLRKQNKLIRMWQFFKNEMELWHGKGVFESRLGILYLILYLIVTITGAIVCLYFILIW